MKNSVVRSVMGILGVLFLTLPAFAYTVSVNQNNGSTYSTTSLTGYSTTGAMMDGMKVKVYFSDQTSEEAIWAGTSSVAGAASGTNWSLSESGDTYGGLWTFVNGTGAGIIAFTIDAGAGDTVFDRTFTGFGTDGSANGWDFSVDDAPAELAINATYSDLVALSGSAPVGDLFRFLTVSFLNDGGFASDSRMTYVTDTDNLALSGDLTSVPEPGTIMLLGGGLLGVAFFGRKRSKA